MASIDEIILRSTNPFDNLRSVNFWHKQKDPEPTVESIHQEAIDTIEETLDQVAQDHRTRTLILDGDSGSGKTYLLGRLKEAFNDKAFFAYIPPFPQSDCIWRHILRYTVDSLVQIPARQQDSQLLLWLKSLSVFKQSSIKQRIMQDDVWDLLRSDRQKFINKLKTTYKQAGIVNADKFFGVLHDLTDPELYPLACEWLRGDDLSEESLQVLRVRSSIETEEAAREMLANFSRIAADTQPIVLCFDQLESIARLSDGSIDLQTLFNVNTKIHDEDNNFLIVISITTNTWKQNEGRIDQSHQARIDRKFSLRLINFKQAESLWASRLYSLHCKANPQASFPIYPLIRQYLEEGFPGGKTKPGEALLLGRDIFQEYKKWIFDGADGVFKPTYGSEKKKNGQAELLATFKLKWCEEFTKVQQRIIRIRYLSSPELIQMLQEALAALQVEEIKTPLFTGTKFASHSLGYQIYSKPGRLGVVWTEDANMTTFFYVMEACQKAVNQNPSQTLLLIRAEGMGNQNNVGYKRYTQIFTGSPHRRITPNLISVHYLATYHNLVKDAREGDLVVSGKTLGLKNLQALIRESKVLYDCPLLQDLEIIACTGEMTRGSDGNGRSGGNNAYKQQLKDFLLNLVTTQHFLGRPTLIQNALNQFSQVNKSQVDQLIQHLCQEKRIQILDPNAKPEAQLVCLVPTSK